MIVTFLANAAPRPIGGAVAIFELANGLARRGHQVHVVHIDFLGQRVRSLEELTWFRFEPRLHHHFPESFDERRLPPADFVVCFDDRVPHDRGLPVSLVMGFGSLPGLSEPIMLSERCPKLCISHYLLEVLAERGVPREQLAYLPLGIDHGAYRVYTPLEDRSRQVAMRCNRHPHKGMFWGMRALRLVQEQQPDVRIVLYGGPEDAPSFSTGMAFVETPGQDELVREIYNESRVFLCSSTREGFGFPGAEAMACGCALVTTNNGGSREFAIHGHTALECEPQDADALAVQVVSLLRRDDERIRLARAGAEFVQRFDWRASARVLDEFLVTYRGDPGRYQTPGLPRPSLTPELANLFEQRKRLANRHLLGKLSVEEYSLDYAHLNNRIEALLFGTAAETAEP